MMEMVKERVQCAALKGRYVVTVAAVSCATALPALAAEGDSTEDVVTVLTSSFSDASTMMLRTIFATLPVVMSVMSAYLCIRFGINFFKRFAK